MTLSGCNAMIDAMVSDALYSFCLCCSDAAKAGEDDDDDVDVEDRDRCSELDLDAEEVAEAATAVKEDAAAVEASEAALDLPFRPWPKGFTGKIDLEGLLIKLRLEIGTLKCFADDDEEEDEVERATFFFFFEELFGCIILKAK